MSHPPEFICLLPRLPPCTPSPLPCLCCTLSTALQEVEYVKEEAKLVYLLECLQKTAPPVLVFAENKKDVDNIHEFLLVKGVEAVAVHGSKDQEEREWAISSFKAGGCGVRGWVKDRQAGGVVCRGACRPDTLQVASPCPALPCPASRRPPAIPPCCICPRAAAGEKDVLIATDVASKGLDFEGIQHVINYDMPEEIENYVHRIGRTGARGSASGLAPTLRVVHSLRGALAGAAVRLQSITHRPHPAAPHSPHSPTHPPTHAPRTRRAQGQDGHCHHLYQQEPERAHPAGSEAPAQGGQAAHPAGAQGAAGSHGAAGGECGAGQAGQAGQAGWAGWLGRLAGWLGRQAGWAGRLGMVDGWGMEFKECGSSGSVHVVREEGGGGTVACMLPTHPPTSLLA